MFTVSFTFHLEGFYSFLSLLLDVANTTKDGKEVTVTTFEPTSRMSTYLLAFIVSDFAMIDGSTKDSPIVVIQI